uniref:Uncharacterized protein n=1 Tax=Seriola dumerili TaxID=41447 RepID=A0A3B4TF85_SERDU
MTTARSGVRNTCTHTNTHLANPLPPPSPLSLCSEKPLSLKILLTNRQGDQSAASQDQQAPPLSPCHVKPLPTRTDPASSPIGSPREDSRTGGPCSRSGMPFSNTGSLPLCDTWEQSPLEDLAPPPPPEEAGLSTQWTRTPPDPIPVQAPPPPRPYSRSPSPVGANDRCQLMVAEEPYYIRQPLTTPPIPSPTSRPVLPPPTYPTRNWSCLHLDLPDAVDSPDPPTYTPQTSPSSLPPPPVSWYGQTCSPPPSQDYSHTLPVERWAENVNRYYGSQNAAGGAGGEGAVPSEELSELDSLYQASLLAPSMHRGSRGVSPQPTGNRPGKTYMFDHMRQLCVLCHQSLLRLSAASLCCAVNDLCSLTSDQLSSGEDESYSAENLRRIARSLSGTVIGSRPQHISLSHSCVSDTHTHTLSFLSFIYKHTLTLVNVGFIIIIITFVLFHLFLLPPHLPTPHPAPPPPPTPGSGPGVQQQFLVVSDRHQTLSGQGLHSVALSYGTLPRTPRRAPPPSSSSSSSSLPRPRAGSSLAPRPSPQSLYATLSHPCRSSNRNGHYRQPSLPSKVNGSSLYAPHPLRLPGDAPAQPLRLDVPPESDWRCDADYRSVQSSSTWDLRTTRPHQTLQRSHPHQPAAPWPRRDPQLCSLCQQLPAEPPRPYCSTCGAYVARFRPVS